MLSSGGCGRTVSPCPRAHSTDGFFLFTSRGAEESFTPLPPLLRHSRRCLFVPHCCLVICALRPLSVHFPHTEPWSYSSSRRDGHVLSSHAQGFCTGFAHTTSWELCVFHPRFAVKGHSCFRLSHRLVWSCNFSRHFNVEIGTVVLSVSHGCCRSPQDCCVAVVSLTL